MKNLNLSVFGDNILECERMVKLIQEAFPEFNNSRNDYSNKFAPKKILLSKSNEISIQLFPDYKSNDRWGSKSILNILEEYGAKLTEAPDVILTESLNGKETILLAIEFSSAIPAGNQAWQRSGRALSFSEVSIPYLYITDIGLEELDADRETKAVRTSNPLVPLSYIKHSQRNKSFTYMVLNPSYLLKESEEIKKYIVKDEVSKIINGLILNEDISGSENSLNEKIANYLNHYKNVPDSVNFSQWIKNKDKNIETFIKSFSLRKYNKIIASKTPIKPQMKKLIKDIVPDYALSIYNNLPICFVPSAQRKNLAKNIKIKCYKNLDAKAFRWISEKKPLIICFINGFKPRGDDARPDRGLLPLARMLFGNEIDIMAIVFGQATFDMQDMFSKKPIQLAKRNGLWKSVLYYSSLTIADSANWTLTDSKLSQFQLPVDKPKELKSSKITFPSPAKSPKKLKENDIDTSIHLTFTANKIIFESLCNPPGGDWSGISFLDCNKKEHRWMSLPRVSDKAKRPDHIFQINHENTHYILIIESKEKLSGLLTDKEELGQALIDYVTDLTEYKSSAILDNGIWKKNIDTDFILNITNYITAAAFFFSKDEEIEKAKKTLNVDFIIGINTDNNQQYFYSNSELGEVALKILSIKH